MYEYIGSTGASKSTLVLLFRALKGQTWIVKKSKEGSDHEGTVGAEIHLASTIYRIDLLIDGCVAPKTVTTHFVFVFSIHKFTFRKTVDHARGGGSLN